MKANSPIPIKVALAKSESWSVVRRFALTVGLAACLILGLLGIMGWLSFAATEARFEAEIQTIVKLVGREADRFVNSADRLLRKISEIAHTTDWSDPAAAAMSQRELESLRGMVPGAFRLFIFDRSGGIRATNVGAVEPGLNVSERDYFLAQVERDAGLFISRPVPALIDQTPIFVLSRRLSDSDGNFAGVASVSVRPEVIAAFYRSLSFAPHATFTWLRADGQRLVSEPFASVEALLAAPVSHAFAQQVARTPRAGSYEFTSPSEGISRKAWYQQVGSYPLYVAIAVESEAVVRAWLDTILPYAAFAAAALLVVAGATTYTLRWARAEDVYKQRLAEALGHKDLLLREVDHRVKNSLQLVCALLQIQASKMADREQRLGFDEAVGRVAAIARVHEQLYRSGSVKAVEVMGYLLPLCAELEQSARARSEPWRVTISGQPMDLPPDDAIKLGLILNELITNAFKYGQPVGQKGRYQVEVSLACRAEGWVSLAVRDHGPGMPTGASPKIAGLGLSLVRSLAEELGGRLRVENAGPGARFCVEFPAHAVMVPRSTAEKDVQESPSFHASAAFAHG